MTTFYAILALGVGSCLALQAAANTRLRVNVESPAYATFFSICGTFLVVSTYLLIVRPSWPTTEMIHKTQWWNWIGGLLGSMIVLGGASLTQKLGAAAFIAFVVGGQLLSSLLLDHFALMGLPQQSLTPGRIIGAILVVVGVVCIKYL